MSKLKHYVAIARPDHWFKNIFMLPGVFIAMNYTDFNISWAWLLKFALAVFSVCLIASANYVINEWLDADFDKYHPVKKNRPSVTQGLEKKWVYMEYALLAIVGLLISSHISSHFLYANLMLLVMGFLYNVKPFRTKDRIYLDVISESINNPLRFCLGWFTISDAFPPSSILLSYWMGGAFLMGAKRFAEYRYINDKKIAGLYRRSFQYYDEQKLLISTFFYAVLSSFFLGSFLIKHKIELIISFPLFATLFAWYLSIAFRENSPVQNPEKLYREKKFIFFVFLLSVVTLILIKIEIPVLHKLLE